MTEKELLDQIFKEILPGGKALLIVEQNENVKIVRMGFNSVVQSLGLLSTAEMITKADFIADMEKIKEENAARKELSKKEKKKKK